MNMARSSGVWNGSSRPRNTVQERTPPVSVLPTYGSIHAGHAAPAAE